MKLSDTHMHMQSGEILSFHVMENIEMEYNAKKETQEKREPRHDLES